MATAYLSFQSTSAEAIIKEIESNLENTVEAIDREASHIVKNAKAGKSVREIPRVDNTFFLYDRGELTYWSDNSFVPSIQTVADTFTLKLLKTGSSSYLVKKWSIDQRRFLISVLMLHKEFKIKNNYLSPQRNEKVFGDNNVAIWDADTELGLSVCVKKQCVFKVTFLDESSQFHQKTRWVALAFLCISGVFLVCFIYTLLPAIKKRNTALGFVFLSVCLVSLRILMMLFNFPNALKHTELFNPQNFASSSYNASLGDLILNQLVVLALCFYLFKSYPYFRVFKSVNKGKLMGTLLLVIFSVCIFYATLFPFVVIQTLSNNSSILLDISESLQFDLLRIGAFIAILISWGCSFLFSHVFIRLLVSVKNKFQVIISILLGVILFALINIYTGQAYVSSLTVASFYFILVNLLKLYRSLQKLSYATFVYLFIAVFCSSLNGAYSINHFNKKERIANQFHFASNFLIDRDYFGEYLLNEVAVKVANDAFIQMRMRSPFFSKDVIRQKVRQVFLPTYFNKYDVDIFIFNPSGSPYDNRSGSTFSELINLYDKEAFRTIYKEVYFINSPSADVTHKYLVIVPVSRLNVTAGYVIIELSLKKIIPESVYPELLVGNSFQEFYQTQDLNYAVFSNKNIVFSSGSFNYEKLFKYEWLGRVDLYEKGIEENGYIHIAEEDELGRAAVVSSKLQSPFFVLSNFSFLLVLGLSVILVLVLIEGFFSYINGKKLFFSTRIQLFLNIAFFLPLIVVSITTLGLTSRSSKEQLDAEYLNNSKTVGAQIANNLDDYLGYANENQIDLENQVTNLAKLINHDANVYNTKGVLIATSQPLIFENNLISTYINPTVIEKIKNGENLFIETESIGKLEYFVSYATLKSPQSGKLIGILGIPFFQSVYSLEKIKTIIFTNILNIFAGIFIVLLLLSYFVSEWLTFPLRFITQTLKRTSLIKTNQPLSWRADDEIGLMVKEYNQMLYKLGESKAELEQTQRERAWREIAQQVAHEIKNPLTPMKLTLQQMERSIHNGTTSPEKTEKALASLLTQVDTLNDIASSFSSFAKMPEPVINKLDLVSLLKRIVNLHSQSGKVNFRTSFKELNILGDEQLLGRIFSNIILNALQAGRPGAHLSVDISLEKKANQALAILKDNGRGIPDDIADQVFIPHFSTKKSGSGLGLAIAKQGIEQMGGNIWFETKAGNGTVFYIDLPLI